MTEATAYTLSAAGTPTLTVLDLGATVVDLRSPDAPEVRLVRAYASVEDQLAPGAGYLGATIGRWANRLGGARFAIDGVEHRVTANEGANALHGGVEGWDRRRWSVRDTTATTLELELVSPDGDQGFPGTVRARVRYEVAPGVVRIAYAATTDAPTPLSMTNHAYFNLAGSGSAEAHVLTVDADAYVPVDAGSIPLGTIAPVERTPFDLRVGRVVGEVVREAHPQMVRGRGIDHSYAVRGSGLRRAARLEDPGSGRALEVWSDQPAVQVYTGNQLPGSVADVTGSLLRTGDGICLETQRHPDAPNHDGFGPWLLAPGEEYAALTEWRIAG